MTIIWSDFASERLSSIVKYYSINVSESVARKIKTDIFSTTSQLKNHPYSGQIEKTLELLNEGYRYLVEGNYKITYKEVKEGILISDIFDTRQDPKKINVKTRRPRE